MRRRCTSGGATNLTSDVSSMAPGPRAERNFGRELAVADTARTAPETCAPTLMVGSLFTGIGGFDLGLERAGFTVAWQVENDPACQRLLAQRWPDADLFGDIKEFDGTARPVDLVCGGFPCQDISRVGRRAGITDGAKSGLWSEMRRVVGEARPRYVLVENSTSITRHGLEVVLADLDALGFDAEWDCLPAAAFGAPHIRDRFYLLAYARSGRLRSPHETVFAGWSSSQLHGGWSAEPDVGRVVDRVPRGMDGPRRARIKQLGNAVVPRVAQWIGERVMADATANRTEVAA
jgi:DNA (cytosine-5)-methyltransferase 1